MRGSHKLDRLFPHSSIGFGGKISADDVAKGVERGTSEPVVVRLMCTRARKRKSSRMARPITPSKGPRSLHAIINHACLQLGCIFPSNLRVSEPEFSAATK
jgi:hypothetical protein